MYAVCARPTHRLTHLRLQSFALAVHVYPYPNNVAAIWIYIAVLIRQEDVLAPALSTAVARDTLGGLLQDLDRVKDGETAADNAIIQSAGSITATGADSRLFDL